MTLDGTNTWILREPGSPSCVVIDPGPDEPSHIAAILDAVDGAKVTQILLTHGHEDHSEGARSLADRLSAPVAALDPAFRFGSEGIHGGDVIECGGLTVEVLATPGHTADSLSFFVPADSALLTGDTVLGRGTTMVAYPDGDLGDYLRSLHSLHRLAVESQVAVLLPGHGQALADPAGVIEGYQAHRQQRLAQVAAARADGAVTAQDVVEIVYAEVARELWPAAIVSVRAQLAYLDELSEPDGEFG
jgi:glyoxylase-like metal-dependent hydrolase (beta-lactamase superfamily II)